MTPTRLNVALAHPGVFGGGLHLLNRVCGVKVSGEGGDGQKSENYTMYRMDV